MKPMIRALAPLALISTLALVGCGSDGGSTSSANVSAECNSAQAALEAGCAGGLGSIFECWDPSGSCELDGLGVTFESGARYEGTVTGLEGRYINSAGQTCGSFEATEIDTSTGSLTADFTNQQGDTYSISSNGSGDLTIGCPGGGSVTLTAKEQEALQACSAPIELCTNSNPNIGPDTFGECSKDSDCPDVQGLTLVCCDFDGQGLCEVREVCETVQQNFGTCTKDSDCTDVAGLNYVCCEAFGVRTCIPQQGCGAF